MAHLYKRRNQFWICYYVNGQRTQKSLQTDNERIAREKKLRIEYELSLGNLQQASRLPLPVVLEDFCKYLKNARTRKSYKNDISRLRIFFGPICDSLKPCPPGVKRAEAPSKVAPDRYAGLHVKAQLLEDITPDIINRFLAQRAKLNGWAPKTRNLMRETLHRLFAFAIKHHRFRSRDVRYPNPAAGVDRLRNPAPKIRFLSLDEIDAQLDVVECQPVIWALTATYIYAGLRREEALWLTHDDIDLSARLIRVRAKAIGEEEWQPKTKRNRCLPISRRLLEIYTQYGEERQKGGHGKRNIGRQ